jgi:predicted metalloprotease with PDZ domain
MRAPIPIPAVVLAAFAVLAGSAADAPIEYTLSFPEPEHRWMQVEVRFPSLPPGALGLQMSRSSPGRYALHEFAKNVFDVGIENARGEAVRAATASLHAWQVEGHGGQVTVRYRVFGDRIDGTYLSVDHTHAHINMPAALMWARGLEDRAARVRFVQPAGKSWQVATQLFPTGDPLVFTAPNLQYLMDSPAEFGAIVWTRFDVPAPHGARPGRFRLALHHAGSDADASAFAGEIAKVAAAQVRVFGEFPAYDVGHFTFIADYLPWAGSDGMEHRNSTVLTSPGSLGGHREDLLGTASHELFHGWNVERIRPRSLEPFDFADANVSGELWLAEGFTSYYDGLFIHRAGLSSLGDLLHDFSGTLDTVLLSPARELRSAVEMSRLAPFVDAARAVDVTYWENTHLSYYTFGAALGLALDLALRDHTNGRASLDDYMKALWQAHGKPGGPAPGLVAAPYTLRDARDRLAEVSDRAFADAFFDRHIEGRALPDYRRLLARAGLVLRPARPGRAWIGSAALEPASGGLRLVEAARFGTPLYQAGLDRDDLIEALDGQPVDSPHALDRLLARHAPGDAVPVRFRRRDGTRGSATLRLAADPRIEIVPVESGGGALGAAERAFREAWLW